MILWRSSGLAKSVAAIVSLFVLSACAVNPVSGEKELSFMSPAQEAEIGRQEHAKIVGQFGGVYDDPRVAGYVAEIGGRLVANSELAGQSFTFTLLNSPVVNAFALPGGYVYVTRGLLALANDEAELAGVLAHEIGHVAARHTAQRMTRGTMVGLGAAVLGAALGVPGELTNLGADLYLKSFSRDQEYEADVLGVRYLRRTGYDPYAQADFLAALAENDEMTSVLNGNDGQRPPELLSTHPRTPARVARAIEAAANSSAPPAAPRRRAEYLVHIAGMIYGDDPAQGLIRGRNFSHAKMRFAFDVPEGFRLVNTDKAVYAKGPDDSLIVMDSVTVDGRTGTRDYFANRWATNVSLRDVEPLDINGMEGFTGWFNGRRGGVPMNVRIVAVRFSSDQIFRFQLAAPAAAAGKLDVGFRRATYSFRRLNEREAAALKPLRLRIVTVRAGDTSSVLASRMSFDEHRERRFRVLNALHEGENPAVGSQVKIVSE